MVYKIHIPARQWFSIYANDFIFFNFVILLLKWQSF